MAVIKAVSSKAGIGHAIDYVTKKEKTEEKLVSGLHCEPETEGRNASHKGAVGQDRRKNL